MPGRKIPLISGEIYHILNRGVASQPIFLDRWDYKRAVETMLYYQNINLPQKYSQFLIQAKKRKEEILKNLREKKEFLVEILSYCFMPNHFHFLLKQLVEEGISKFLSNFQNSYTRYFNTRHQREGVLFQGKFKNILIETDEQLIHISRYIHLNPYSSSLVKTFNQIVTYPYSSLGEYLGKNKTNYCQKEIVLGLFRSPKAYQESVFNQAEYQRKLDQIKHLILEER